MFTASSLPIAIQLTGTIRADKETFVSAVEKLDIYVVYAQNQNLFENKSLIEVE